MSQTIQEKNKALVLEAFEALFNKRDYEGALRYWSPNYIQHSAHIAPGREGLFDLIKSIPRVTSETEDGQLLESRDAPRAAFRGHRQETPWDNLHVAYFTGYALWTYLTIPFLYAYPGFVTEELSPWREDGETWRPLKAVFPDSIASHTREQVSYFGEDGLLRRHEYTVDIMDGARGVNYASDYRDVDGIKVPAKRRVYAYDDGKNKLPVPLLVAIDFGDIAFAER